MCSARDRKAKVFVWLIGSPAVGKSTLRHVVSVFLAERAIYVPAFGIEEAHRLLCPAWIRHSSYKYAKDGALRLFDTSRQVQEAMQVLHAWCRFNNYGFLVELSNPEYDSIRLLLDEFDTRKSLTIGLYCPKEVRVARNRRRGLTKIPENYLKSFPDEVISQAIEHQRNSGGMVIELNTDDALDNTSLKLYSELNKLFSSHDR